MSNREKATKQIRVTSKHTAYPQGRIIVIDNKSADEWVANGDAEYCHKYDIPALKRGPGRPKKEIEVAAVEPSETPEGNVKRIFRRKGKKA